MIYILICLSVAGTRTYVKIKIKIKKTIFRVFILHINDTHFIFSLNIIQRGQNIIQFRHRIRLPEKQTRHKIINQSLATSGKLSDAYLIMIIPGIITVIVDKITFRIVQVIGLIRNELFGLKSKNRNIFVVRVVITTPAIHPALREQI